MTFTKRTKKYWFITAGLLVAAVLVFIPSGHLSAEAPVSIDEKIKVRKATIVHAPANVDAWIVDIDGAKVTVYVSTSTQIFLGNGEEADSAAIQGGEKVYLFGIYKKDSNTIALEKVVIRSHSPFSRKEYN